MIKLRSEMMSREQGVVVADPGFDGNIRGAARVAQPGTDGLAAVAPMTLQHPTAVNLHAFYVNNKAAAESIAPLAPPCPRRRPPRKIDRFGDPGRSPVAKIRLFRVRLLLWIMRRPNHSIGDGVMPSSSTDASDEGTSVTADEAGADGSRLDGYDCCCCCWCCMAMAMLLQVYSVPPPIRSSSPPSFRRHSVR